MLFPIFTFKRNGRRNYKGLLVKGLFCTFLIVWVFSLMGCSVPGADEPEPEPEITPEETEEVERLELAEIEAVVSVETGSTLAIRESAGTQDKPEGDVLDRVPEGRVLIIIDKHNDSLVEDGYTWWEVEDTTTGISGWAASEFLEEK